MSRTGALGDQIFKLSGGSSGPTMAVFAGVHGNERAGVMALRQLLPSLKITKGTLYFVFANPPAIDKNVRLLGKNLNRCFEDDNDGQLYEDKRARELMELLNKSDALLDIHAFNDTAGEPFVICEEASLEIAQKMDVAIISTGWTEAEPGAADGYMHGLGKPAICLECGPVIRAAEFKNLAIESIMQLLKHFGMVDTNIGFSTLPKQIVNVSYSVKRLSKDYFLTPRFKNFQLLKEGELICTQDGKPYLANDGDRIIFPRQHPPIGAEAFLIGRLQQ